MLRGMTWKKWLLGMVDAVIGGALGSITIVIVDPTDFNLFEGGAKRLGIVAAANGLVSLALWWKSHRLPGLDEE